MGRPKKEVENTSEPEKFDEFIEGFKKIRQESLPKMKVAFVREGAIFEKSPKSPHAAAYDVKVYGATIEDGYIKYFLGIMTEMPEGWYAEVVHRSSNSGTQIGLANKKGTIDLDFRGEWQARVRVERSPVVVERDGKFYIDWDATKKQMNDPIRAWQEGEKALQVIFHKLDEHQVVFVDKSELSNTERGEGGHGSTGNGLLTDHILNR